VTQFRRLQALHRRGPLLSPKRAHASVTLPAIAQYYFVSPPHALSENRTRRPRVPSPFDRPVHLGRRTVLRRFRLETVPFARPAAGSLEAHHREV